MRYAIALVAAALGLAPPPIAAYGLRLDVPAGWHARIYKRPGREGLPILHAANVPLGPMDGDDIATTTQRRLHLGGILIVLFDYAPPREGTARWKKTFPVAHEPFRVRRPLTGMEGAIAPAAVSRAFQLAGHYFQLIVFFGEPNPDARQFARANRVLAHLHVSPRG